MIITPTKVIFLLASEFWEVKEEDDVSNDECEFSAKSPIKAFKPRK